MSEISTLKEAFKSGTAPHRPTTVRTRKALKEAFKSGTAPHGANAKRFEKLLKKYEHIVNPMFVHLYPVRDCRYDDTTYRVFAIPESNYPAFPMSGKDVLWALSEDCQPCVIAYDTSQMLVCRAELQDGRIRRRENQAEILDFTVPCVKTIWLLRQTEEKPVFEVDILYCKDGETKELKLMRFGVDVDGGMNFHKFRNFTNTLKAACKENNLGIRNLVR